eukprot:3641080-Rhodomonas_salina.1
MGIGMGWDGVIISEMRVDVMGWLWGSAGTFVDNDLDHEALLVCTSRARASETRGRDTRKSRQRELCSEGKRRERAREREREGEGREEGRM